MWVCVLHGMRAEQTVLSNRTLGEKNNWLVVEEEKTQPFWPFICSNHRIISAMEIEPIPLCPKRMCASLIEFELKIKFKKCYPTHSDVWAIDVLWLQMLTTCSSLRKPWETKGTDKNVCTQSPSYGALPPFLWSWTKSLFIHSTGIMRDRNIFEAPREAAR